MMLHRRCDRRPVGISTQRRGGERVQGGRRRRRRQLGEHQCIPAAAGRGSRERRWFATQCRDTVLEQVLGQVSADLHEVGLALGLPASEGGVRHRHLRGGIHDHRGLGTCLAAGRGGGGEASGERTRGRRTTRRKRGRQEEGEQHGDSGAGQTARPGVLLMLSDWPLFWATCGSQKVRVTHQPTGPKQPSWPPAPSRSPPPGATVARHQHHVSCDQSSSEWFMEWFVSRPRPSSLRARP